MGLTAAERLMVNGIILMILIVLESVGQHLAAWLCFVAMLVVWFDYHVTGGNDG